jgi:hypothetical protein
MWTEEGHRISPRFEEEETVSFSDIEREAFWPWTESASVKTQFYLSIISVASYTFN